MRISDWSSDVCSSDLSLRRGGHQGHASARTGGYQRNYCRVRTGDHAGDRPYSAASRLCGAGRQIFPCERNALLPHESTVEKRRSEEHTSELQSLMRISYAVFCLKKKQKYKTIHNK